MASVSLAGFARPVVGEDTHRSTRRAGPVNYSGRPDEYIVGIDEQLDNDRVSGASMSQWLAVPVNLAKATWRIIRPVGPFLVSQAKWSEDKFFAFKGREAHFEAT